LKVKEKNYNIHDIIKFRIVDKTSFFYRYLNLLNTQLENFESEKVDNPDFTVHIGNFVPSNQDCYILDDKYYVKKDYFYCKDSRKLSKFEIEIMGFENGPMKVNIKTNLPGSISVPVNIIDFLIHLKLNEKGFPIVHASSISKNCNAYLFAARGGGGKTTVSLNLLEKGFSFMADNFTILNNGHALSFLIPFNLFNYNLTPLIKKRCSKNDRIIIHLKYVFYKLTFGYIKMRTKVNIKEILPNQVGNRSKVKGVFLLIPRDRFHIEKISKEEFIKHMVFNQQNDFTHLPFLNYLLAYSYMYPNSKITEHWNEYEENIRKNLPKNIDLYKVEVPLRYKPEDIDEIYKFIS